MRFETIIINELGLHAYAAVQFVETANKYESDIRVLFNNKEADGRNFNKLLGLRIEKNDRIIVMIEGEDEQLAFNDIKALIDDNFGE